MSEIDEIFVNVCQVIENSIGKPKEDIKLENTLFDELEVDSIDLVDILFELETIYEVELKVSDIEARARKDLGDIPYEIDGVITPDGLKALKKYMTDLDQTEIKEGLTVRRLIQLFTVHSLCTIVKFRLDSEEEKEKK